MNQELMDMAEQAGYKDLPTVRLAYQGFDKEKFAALVAAAEREACAKVCESYLSDTPYSGWATTMAAAIRARGETT
jgi:hypothetical protein